MSLPLSPEQERAQRIAMLRGCIKLLLGIGFLFLLLPFFKSLPWPDSEIPADSVLIGPADLPAGATIKVTLPDGSAVFVTRSTEALRASLDATPTTMLWSPSAPGIADQPWWVVSAQSTRDEAVLPSTDGSYLLSASGAAWDKAGRALKPGALNGKVLSPLKNQNLMPMPFKRHGEGILLLPVPPIPSRAAVHAVETPS